ncbi:translin-associated protein X isoform X2 [Mustelus asterias]
MSKEGGFRKRKYDNVQSRNRKEERESKVNPSSPVLLSFKSFQKELDAKHDKYERLVKLSRDITIESKRIIFLLHRVSSVSDIEELLNESEAKFGDVRQKIQQISQELIGEDMCQFHRAFSPGLQEYVEAVSFQHFIRTRSLICLDEINRHLVFPPKKEEAENSEDVALSDSQGEKQKQLCLQVTPTDYLLGIADLTGELMRMCITSVGNGDIETPFEEWNVGLGVKDHVLMWLMGGAWTAAEKQLFSPGWELLEDRGVLQAAETHSLSLKASRLFTLIASIFMVANYI